MGAILLTAVILLCLQYNVAKDAEDESSGNVPAKLLQPVASYQDTQRNVQDVSIGGGGGGNNVRSNSLSRQSGTGGGGGGGAVAAAKPVQFIAANSINAADFQMSDQRFNNYPQFQAKQSYYSNGARKQIYVPPRRLVHFDLKGAPPKVSYLKSVFHLIKRLGATGILLEWEDMFPWKGPIKDLAATNAYTLAQVKDIVASAQEKNLEVIPLIQTFGHMEFALKYNTFAHLREVPESSQALCPSLNDSLLLIDHMVDQVLSVHKDIQYLHIGCDEVFQMGECPRCRSKMREDLFLSHVAAVARIVRRKSRGVTPLIWDDMLRHLPAVNLQMYKIGELVEPMVWVYAEDIYRFVPSNVWEKLSSVFPYVWTASAFKGAFGETMYVPNVKRHLENNLNWLELMNNEQPMFKGGFRGIAITGWQRYDHFATLCELLPAAIPSLAVNVLATSNGFFNGSLKTQLTSALECNIMAPSSISLLTDPFLWDSLGRCQFPGHLFFSFTNRFNSLQREVNEFLEQIEKKRSWMTSYNVHHNFSSPLRVDELLMDEPRLYHSATSMVHSAIEALQDVYDTYTVAEWIEQNLSPIIKKLEKIQMDGANLKNRHVWQRRPFPVSKDLEKFGLVKGESNSRNGLTLNRASAGGGGGGGG